MASNGYLSNCNECLKVLLVRKQWLSKRRLQGSCKEAPSRELNKALRELCYSFYIEGAI
jgi:hypothetical protein